MNYVLYKNGVAYRVYDEFSKQSYGIAESDFKTLKKRAKGGDKIELRGVFNDILMSYEKY